MSRIFFCVIGLLLTISVNAQSSQSRSISYIETTSTWIHIYDESGKIYYTDSRSRFGDVVGYSSSFFIVLLGSFYVLYDANCKRLNTLTVSNIGEILSVAGQTFTARHGSFVCTYDMNGKKLNTRTVQ
jgi:hypothetical protein